MAIIAIEEINEDSLSKTEIKEREIEIKGLINELQLGYQAIVDIKCPISSYRVSFNYYLKQYEDEMKIGDPSYVEKKFSIIKTDKSNIWKVIRKA